MSFDVADPSGEEDPAETQKPAPPRPRWIPPSLPNIPTTNIDDDAAGSNRGAGRTATGSLTAMCAAGLTAIAVLIAFGMLLRGGDPSQDYLSPPFALVGGILVILSMARRHKSRHLLISTLVLNGSYWLYFLAMFVSSAN